MYNLLHNEQLHVSALFIGHSVVVLYVTNYTNLYHHIVVLDKYTHYNLVYYKHNGDDEPYVHKLCSKELGRLCQNSQVALLCD